MHDTVWGVNMSRPSTLPAEWKELIDVAGSVRGLASEIGLRATTSLWRIAHGQTRPGMAVMQLLEQYCRLHRLAMPKEFKK
jgi:hypothetical protein